MKNEIILNLRQFPVLAHDHRDGQEKRIVVTVACVVDLDKLVEEQEERDKWNYLYGAGGGEAGE